jgi:hypothetical protein
MAVLVLGVLPALAAGRLTAEETKPLAVTVFYSREDPRWPRAERIIEASAQPFGAKVSVEKVSYDDPAGYARLAKLEKELPVEKPGELTAAAGNFALTSSGERRDVENYLAAVLARMLGGADLKKRRAAEAAEYAREVFRQAQAAVEKDHEKLGGVYFRVTADGRLLGWVVDAYRTIQCPICYDAQFLVAVAAGPELRVVGVQPIRELELYGKPVSGGLAMTFLRQFEGRTPRSTNRVDAIVGATKTSLAYERGVHEVLLELQVRHPVTEPEKAVPQPEGAKP